MQKVRAQAKAGLDWLAEQDGSAVPTQDYAAHLPVPVPQELVDRDLLLGFVFSEFIYLRQRVNAAGLPDMARRLDALENRLAELDPKS